MRPALALALATLLASASAAQGPALTLGAPSARVATLALQAGFGTRTQELRLAGTLDVLPMRLGPGCRGFVGAQADFFVDLRGSHELLRFFVRSSEDVTLVVRDPGGGYRCNDDVRAGVDTTPMVDITRPAPGRYEVRIGSHRAVRGEGAAATLHVTDDRATRP